MDRSTACPKKDSSMRLRFKKGSAPPRTAGHLPDSKAEIMKNEASEKASDSSYIDWPSVVATYTLHFQNSLESELAYECAQTALRINTWSRANLEAQGWALFDLVRIPGTFRFRRSSGPIAPTGQLFVGQEVYLRPVKGKSAVQTEALPSTVEIANICPQFVELNFCPCPEEDEAEVLYRLDVATSRVTYTRMQAALDLLYDAFFPKKGQNTR
eukprot:RCo046521